MKALTIRQPWAWAIFHAGKRIENRGRKDGREPANLTRYRGELIIHASATMTMDDHESAVAFMMGRGLATNRFGDKALPIVPPRRQRVGDAWLPRGAILGKCRVVGAVREMRDFSGRFEEYAFDMLRRPAELDMRWWTGGYGLVLAEVVPATNMVPCKGRQGLWDVPDETLARVRWPS